LINITNVRAKIRVQRALLRQMRILEKAFAADLRKILREEYDEMSDLFAAGIKQIDHISYWYPDMIAAFSAAYKRTGRIFSALVFDEMVKQAGKKSVMPSEIKTMGDEFWNSFETFTRLYTAEKVVRIQDATKRALSRIIGQGIQNGKSPNEIAKDIREYDRRFSPGRSDRIARTETHMASNFSTNEAVKSTRLQMEKEWVAFADDRTRTAHREMNGKPSIGTNDLFVVGGERLAYPGDPRGSAWNVINCRCVLLYHTRKK
jgi:SPP1 gp7 family putative phage head morphogenesis protein